MTFYIYKHVISMLTISSLLTVNKYVFANKIIREKAIHPVRSTGWQLVCIEKKILSWLSKRKCAELVRNLEMCSEIDEEDRGKGVKWITFYALSLQTKQKKVNLSLQSLSLSHISTKPNTV
jgi:hypothetical protein